MAFPERRRYPRVATSSLVSYFLTNNKGAKIGQGVGKTINISPNGILIETSRAIDSKYVLILAKDLDDKMMEIKGQVVYSRKITPEVYECGINFQGDHAENVKFRRDLIRVFHFRNIFSHRL
jgi:hypothetical protein